MNFFSVIKIFFCIILFAKSCFAESEYLFYQQFNDMCTIAPMLNLDLLKKIIDDYGSQILEKDQLSGKQYYNFSKIPQSFWHSRREWFGKEFLPLNIWHEMLNKVCDQGFASKNLPYFRDYMEQAVNKGPVTPHFYDLNGKFVFFGYSGALNLVWWPFFLIDFESARDIKIKCCGCVPMIDLSEQITHPGVKLPIVKDGVDNKFKFYNQIIDKYQDIDLDSDIDPIENTDIFLNFLNIDKNLSTYKNLFEKKDFWVFDNILGGNLGFDFILKTNRLAGGFRYQNKIYLPYMMGFYKVLLLKLGLDNNNENIYDKNFQDLSLKNLIKEFDFIANIDQQNPWSETFFKKEEFIQFQITEIFKKNKELFYRTQRIIDFYLKPWFCYKTFIDGTEVIDQNTGKVLSAAKYFKQNKKPYIYHEVMQYLPGQEQALAYMVTMSLRLLFYGASSSKASAFYKATSFWVPFLWSFDGFKKLAYKKNSYGDSFVSVWQEIKFELLKNTQIKNFISFDDHGWVISLDEKMILAQIFTLKDSSEFDSQIISDLGFTGIESLHSSYLNTFYKRSRV